jgi:ubiquinone/menaquinone biosynthesis C-methylase UbiE
MVPMGASDFTYDLGHDAAELDRLAEQGRILEPATRALLQAAGVGAGMRVLDLGSGAGDVSFLAAELVGPAGTVVGLERSADAVATAAARARRLGLGNVDFVAGDIHEPAPGGPFDAIICRMVLMYVPDPAAALSAQATVLRPGGVIAPIELDVSSAVTRPLVPFVEQVGAWVRETFERAGIAATLGTELWSVLRRAGLRPLGMRGVQQYFVPGDPDGPALFAGVVRALLPLMVKTGVATAGQVDLATLEGRLADELLAADAVFAHPTLVSAWGTIRD